MINELVRLSGERSFRGKNSKKERSKVDSIVRGDEFIFSQTDRSDEVKSA